MSTIATLVLCAIFALSSGDRDSEFLAECMNDDSVTEEDFEKYDFETDKALCFVKCLFTKRGVLDEEGNIINVDKIDGITGRYKFAKHELANFMDCIEAIGQIKKCKDVKKMELCYDVVDK